MPNDVGVPSIRRHGGRVSAMGNGHRSVWGVHQPQGKNGDEMAWGAPKVGFGANGEWVDPFYGYLEKSETKKGRYEWWLPRVNIEWSVNYRKKRGHLGSPNPPLNASKHFSGMNTP